MEGPTGTSDLTTQEIDFLFNPQSDIDFTAWFTNLDQDMVGEQDRSFDTQSPIANVSEPAAEPRAESIAIVDQTCLPSLAPVIGEGDISEEVDRTCSPSFPVEAGEGEQCINPTNSIEAPQHVDTPTSHPTVGEPFDDLFNDLVTFDALCGASPEWSPGPESPRSDVKALVVTSTDHLPGPEITFLEPSLFNADFLEQPDAVTGGQMDNLPAFNFGEYTSAITSTAEPQTAQPEVQPENEWQELTTAHSAWPTLSMQGIALPGLALPPASGPGADDLQSLPIQGATLPGGIAQVLFEPNQVFPLVDAGFAVPDPQDNLVAYPTKCTLDQMLGLDGLSEGQPKVSSEPYKAACSDSSDEQPAKHRKRQGGKARGQLPEPARGYKPEIALDQPWVRVNYTTLGKNRRPAKIVAFDPKTAYDHLQETPEPWDGFEYNWAGELRTGRAYSTSQLRRYLYDHPLHSYNGEERDTKRSRLRILIQRAPADSARRRPTAASEMCRWMKCPCPRKVIRVGHFRVAFDEQGWKKGGLREHHDPYVNAGYLHLYCAEKIFDFPEAVGQLNVRADTRKLKREPGGVNRMGLGAARVAPEAEDFLTECNATGAPANYPRLADYPAGKRPYVGTLNHRLQLAKTEREMPCRQRRREELGDRPGQVQNHLGDLEAVVLDRHNKRKRTCVSKAISYAATVEAGSEHDTSKSIGSQTPHIASRRQRKRQPEVAAYTGDGDDEQNSTSEVEEVPRPRKKARG